MLFIYLLKDDIIKTFNRINRRHGLKDAWLSVWTSADKTEQKIWALQASNITFLSIYAFFLNIFAAFIAFMMPNKYFAYIKSQIRSLKYATFWMSYIVRRSIWTVCDVLSVSYLWHVSINDEDVINKEKKTFLGYETYKPIK